MYHSPVTRYFKSPAKVQIYCTRYHMLPVRRLHCLTFSFVLTTEIDNNNNNNNKTIKKLLSISVVNLHRK